MITLVSLIVMDTRDHIKICLEKTYFHRMSFDDFMRHFNRMEICNLGPDVMDEVQDMTGMSMENAGYGRWNTRCHLGAWIGRTAGGCRNYLGVNIS